MSNSLTTTTSPQQAGPAGHHHAALRCADRLCATGMEMSAGNRRKVISDFFGRNKAETSAKERDPEKGIPLAVW